MKITQMEQYISHIILEVMHRLTSARRRRQRPNPREIVSATDSLAEISTGLTLLLLPTVYAVFEGKEKVHHRDAPVGRTL
jgi:hypothetical protein